MSIATEIQRLQNAKSSIKTSIENKGVVVSSSDTLDDYSAYIDAINISTQEKTITVQNQTHEITADSGYRGLSKVILDGVLVDAHDSYTSSTDSTTAYTKTVPSGALKYANLDKLGGMSYKSNNLAYIANPNRRLSNTTGVLVDSTSDYGTTDYIEVIEGETYSTNIRPYSTTNYASVVFYNANKGFVSTIRGDGNARSFTIDTGVKYIRAAIRYSNQPAGATNMMINRGSTELPYEPYFDGIRDSAVTSIVSEGANLINKDNSLIGYSINATTGEPFESSQNYCSSVFIKVSPNTQYTFFANVNIGDIRLSEYSTNDASGNIKRTSSANVSYITITTTATTEYVKWSFNYNNSTATQAILDSLNLCLVKGTSTTYVQYRGTIETYNIPAEIQALTGYGQSNPDDATEYNYIDFDTKEFVRVGYIDNGVWVASALTTDISAYLTNDNFIDVEAGGSITANNTYNQDVPSEITYLVEV